jgi:hypothetical protein
VIAGQKRTAIREWLLAGGHPHTEGEIAVAGYGGSV